MPTHGTAHILLKPSVNAASVKLVIAGIDRPRLRRRGNRVLANGTDLVISESLDRGRRCNLLSGGPHNHGILKGLGLGLPLGAHKGEKKVLDIHARHHIGEVRRTNRIQQIICEIHELGIDCDSWGKKRAIGGAGGGKEIKVALHLGTAIGKDIWKSLKGLRLIEHGGKVVVKSVEYHVVIVDLERHCCWAW